MTDPAFLAIRIGALTPEMERLVDLAAALPDGPRQTIIFEINSAINCLLRAARAAKNCPGAAAAPASTPAAAPANSPTPDTRTHAGPCG